MTGPAGPFLPQATLSQLVEDALATLATVGVLVEDEQARSRLEAGGCETAEGWTRIPAHLVERCLASAPRTVALHDRDGALVCELGAGGSHHAPGSAALNVLDLDTRRHRAATRKDCVHLARLVQSLPGLAVQSTGLVPADVPVDLADMTRLHIALSESSKPVVTGTFHEDSFAVMKRMLVAIRGSEQALAERPLALFDCCPTPPLRWSRLSCRTLVECARSHVPVTVVSMPIGGATAPVTILERVIQHTAEVLCGLVIHQLTGPGAPILFGGAAATCDMRLGTSPTAGPESISMGAICAQVGRVLGLPTQFFLGTSDAKIPDWQAGAESAVALLMASLSGVDLVTGLGMLDFIGCLSLEQLVLDHEAARVAARLARGPGSLTVESPSSLLGELSRSGRVLAHAHTRKHFREALHVPGPALDRATRTDWASAGSLDAASRAHAEVCKVIDKESGWRLEPSRRDALRRVLEGEYGRHGASWPEGL